MSETKKHNTHLPKFKARVGLEVVQGVKTINQIAQDAQENGVHPVQVGQCKREIQAQAKTLFEGKRGPQPIAAHSAPDRLFGEIERLKMELYWLKKSQGSACHDRWWLDRRSCRRDTKAPMRAGRCCTRYALPAA